MRSYRFLYSLMCLLVSLTAFAQRRYEVRHYVTASLSGAYGLPVGNYEHLQRFDAMSGQLTIGYEAAWPHLLLQTGLGVQLNKYRMSAEDYTTSLRAWDTQGVDFIYTYNFHNRKDKASVTSLAIPLLAGGRWSYFYFLSGLVGTFRVYERGSSNALVSCTGEYTRYIGDFSDMTNHALYVDEQLSAQYDETYVHAKYQISPYVEVGADFSTAENALTGYRTKAKSEVRIRIAAFAQCGLINEHSAAAHHYPFEVNPNTPYDLQSIKIPALLGNDYISGNQLRNMYFGARITILFRSAGHSAFCVSCGY